MLLVDRYVQAVRSELPRKQRDDIAAELRETLLSQIEEMEAGLGRSPTDDEVAAMLTRYGAPDVVAASYGAPNYLIGPRIYPHYRFVVKVILWVFAAGVAISLAVTASNAENVWSAMARTLFIAVLVLIGNLTIMTLLFARIERLTGDAGAREHWNPRELLETPAAVRTSIPRAETLGGLLLTVTWLLWWTDVLPINKWLLWSKMPLEPAQVWNDLTPLIVALMVANIVVCAFVALRPRWVTFYDAAGVLLDIGIGIVLIQALRVPALIVVTDATSSAARLATAFNALLTILLIAWALLLVGSIASVARRWIVVSRHAVQA